jgi:predicted pyridoxine 5'-phosphate oxidase superfamily flavin-nucleotide-binding protein
MNLVAIRRKPVEEGNAVGILTNEMQRVVREQRLGFVATVCPDGTPNLSPKGTTTVWDDDHLLFADIRSPATIANLQRNPAVEINVVDVVRRKGFRFKGTATVVTGGPRFEELLSAYRGSGDDIQDSALAMIRGLVLVRVERALPLTSPAYDLGLTEEQVTEQWEGYWNELRARRDRPG